MVLYFIVVGVCFAFCLLFATWYVWMLVLFVLYCGGFVVIAGFCLVVSVICWL